MGFVVHRSASYRRMRWKNGLGETAEVAIAPAGAALDDFDWRISMARVESAGPFSPFAGVDRTLAILAGDGLRLAPAGRDAIVLGPASEPYAFAGDVPCDATLAGGAVTDLNVMTRRGRYWQRVHRIGAGTRTAAQGLAAAFLVAPEPGPATACIDGVDVVLGALDSVSLGTGPWTIAVRAGAAPALLLVEIGPAGR